MQFLHLNPAYQQKFIPEWTSPWKLFVNYGLLEIKYCLNQDNVLISDNHTKISL